MEYTVEGLMSRGSFDCPCGKVHSAHLKKAIVCDNAISFLPDEIKNLGGSKAFIVADKNTLAAAGEQVFSALGEAGIGYTLFTYKEERTEPDERAIGSLVLHWDYSCDILVGIGSGVINDICKIISRQKALPFIIVGTAPSMDGYASSTSSVVRDGLKVSVDSRCPDVIIGDLDVLAASPMLMIQAGLGDMLAKYTSVCEWRIGHIVTGEYYCEEVAAIIRSALKKIVDNAAGIISRDNAAVKAVMEGLIISGIAADYAGVSRPVSGVEHYFSHLWDMRALEFGTPWSLHGIQCGIGTLLAAKGYENLVKHTPDIQRVNEYSDAFDSEKRCTEIKEYLGKAGDAILETLFSSDRYNREKHLARLCNIAENWDEILRIVKDEMPSSGRILEILRTIDAPVSSADIGIPVSENPLTFRLTMDIRDKYILSTLMFDLGLTDEAEMIYGGNNAQQ